jgi:putative redox protein
MTTKLSIHAVHQGEMRVLAGDGTHQVLMDYPMQQGATTEGLTPLQLLLASLSACSANSVSLLLKKMHQPISGLEVAVHALRSSEHPTVLTEISMDFRISGSGVDPNAVAQSLQLSEEKVCPVWNMLKSATPIKATYRITDDPQQCRENE